MAKTIENTLLKDTVPFKVAKVYLYDTKTKMEYGMSTLKSSELDAKSDQIEVRGGQTDDIEYIIDKPRVVKFNLEDIVENQNLTAFKLGDGTIRDVTTNIDGFHMPKIYIVETSASDLIITLDEEPKTGEEITFKNATTGLQIDNTKVVQDATNKKEFKITDVAILSGDGIEAGGFKFIGKTTDKYYNLVSSSSIPELFCVIELPIMKKDMTHVCNKQYILPRTKLDASVNSQTTADPKEVSSKHVLTVLRPSGSEYLGTVYFKMIDTVTP